MKNKKLTSTQIWVIEHMQDGYELGQSTGYWSSTWMQKGGCGKGGDSKKVLPSTLSALSKYKIIEVKPGQSTFAKPLLYQLTKGGRELALLITTPQEVNQRLK